MAVELRALYPLQSNVSMNGFPAVTSECKFKEIEFSEPGAQKRL
jgi:hypothetical protein